MATEVESRWHDRIVHATLQLGEFDLMGADVFPADYRKPEGFFVALTIDDLAKAERVFSSLADGGEVLLPIQSTFWSAGFGVLVDRFAVPWEINCAQPSGPT
jgi:PhnB protein